MPVDGSGPRQRVRQAEAKSAGRAGTIVLQADRRGMYAATVLWQSQDGGVFEGSRPSRQSQACAATNAANEIGGHGAGAKHQQGASRARGLSLPDGGNRLV